MARNVVTIQVKALTKDAEKGFVALTQRMDDTQKRSGRLSQSVGSLDRAFGGFGRNLMSMAAGAFSVTVVLSKINESMGRVAKTAGFSDAVMAGFSQDFRNNLARIEGQFEGLREKTAFTANDLKNAFTIITRESRSASVGTTELKAAMGLAQITGQDLAGASQDIGRALLGDINPLRAVLGEIGSVDEAFERLIKGGRTATTVTDSIGGSIKGVWEELGASIDEFLAGKAGEVLEPAS